MSDEKIGKAVEEGIKVKNEVVENFLSFLASMEEEAEVQLDGLKLRVGKFYLTLRGNMDLKIEVREDEE